ncbi:MAG: hypothetical protein JSV95_02805 [Gemmatimonadota bacterium]|nr:MAG: hypothetical protein JSV95_02805 [Gemmatimonadota bacterium]
MSAEADRSSGDSLSLVDLHTHFVPGVDDGARSTEEALAALGALCAQGVTRVATTPHLRASRAGGSRKLVVREKYEALRSAAAEALPDLGLSLAYEVRLDEPEVDLSDRSLGLSDRHLLVEFSMLVMPAFPVETLEVATRQDWVPVLAHPERYSGIEARYRMIAAWREMGALMCLNVASLWGRYGREAETVAHRMLADGLVDVIASDHHARPNRSESVRQAWDRLAEAGHQEAARLLLSANPGAILDGLDPAPVPAVRLGDGWSGRIKRFIGWSR